MAAISPSLTHRNGLWHWAVFGGMLSAAGLPIYLHAPKFYVDNYGVSLATLGGVLAALRLIDLALVDECLFGRSQTWQLVNAGKSHVDGD